MHNKSQQVANEVTAHCPGSYLVPLQVPVLCEGIFPEACLCEVRRSCKIGIAVRGGTFWMPSEAAGLPLSGTCRSMDVYSVTIVTAALDMQQGGRCLRQYCHCSRLVKSRPQGHYACDQINFARIRCRKCCKAFMTATLEVHRERESTPLHSPCVGDRRQDSALLAAAELDIAESGICFQGGLNMREWG